MALSLGKKYLVSKDEQTSALDISQSVCVEERDPKKPYISAQFAKYYEDADRLLDMFTMIDFYGRKRRCIEFGHLLTKDDQRWYKD